MNKKYLPLIDPAITTKSTTQRFTTVKILFANEDSLAPKASAAEKKIVNYLSSSSSFRYTIV